MTFAINIPEPLVISSVQSHSLEVELEQELDQDKREALLCRSALVLHYC